jgi:hypothetical protein
MQHPILKDTRSLLIYAVIWTIIIIAESSAFYYNYHFDFTSSITSSFIFNALFAFMGLAIWYVVLYSYPEKVSFVSLIINHITAASVFILLWSFTGLFLNRTLLTQPIYNFIVSHIFGYVIIAIVYYSIFMLVYYLIIYNSNLKERKKNEDRLLAMVKEAELNLLKSQINPHFLFNSLNSISSLTITNPSKAQEMIIKLSDFLRYSIARDNNQKSTLKLELENIQRYLDIEKIRFGSRLEYKPEIDEDSLEKMLPVMILQPLFENAVKHGVYESTEPVVVSNIINVEGNFLTITIKNNFDTEAPSKKGAGIGLKNIAERLRITYQTEGLLKILKNDNTFEVKLLIPQIE